MNLEKINQMPINEIFDFMRFNSVDAEILRPDVIEAVEKYGNTQGRRLVEMWNGKITFTI